MRKRSIKILSLLLTLAMVMSLMPGMSLTAYAANKPSVTISPDGGGTVSYSYDSNQNKWTLTPVPEEGYSLEKWTYNYAGSFWEGEWATLRVNDQYTNITVFLNCLPSQLPA